MSVELAPKLEEQVFVTSEKGGFVKGGGSRYSHL